MTRILSTPAALFAAVLTAACAADPATTADAPRAAQATQADNKVCVREYPIGSSVPVTRCRTPEQIEAERAAAAETARRMQSTGSGADGRK